MTKSQTLKTGCARRASFGYWILRFGIYLGFGILGFGILNADDTVYPRAPANTLEAQIALARRNISSGSIDGKYGEQTRLALLAFQEEEALDATGSLNTATLDALQLDSPPLANRTVTAEELATLGPLPSTWLEKSQQPTLAYATALEMVAEQAHASPALIRQLNPAINWDKFTAGTTVVIPDLSATTRTATTRIDEKAARIIINLGEHTLQIRADDGRLLAHFPVSIARDIEKRPVGTLHVKVIAPNPNYTFDPEIFTESEEGRQLGRKLIIPPGPNNPVGLVWIGLDRPGYGIHGTPEPEKVGRTESHGCFRLANWNALALLDLVEIGTPVYVLP